MDIKTMCDDNESNSSNEFEQFKPILDKLKDNKLTGKYFKIPVLCPDGNIHELNALMKNMINKKIILDEQPVKIKEIKKIKYIIDEFIKYNPSIKNDQYTDSYINHNQGIKLVDNLIETKNYICLKAFNKFDGNLIKKKNLTNIIKFAPPDIQKHFFKNLIDININIKKELNLINYILEKGNCNFKEFIINESFNNKLIQNNINEEYIYKMLNMHEFSLDKKKQMLEICFKNEVAINKNIMKNICECYSMDNILDIIKNVEHINKENKENIYKFLRKKYTDIDYALLISILETKKCN